MIREEEKLHDERERLRNDIEALRVDPRAITVAEDSDFAALNVDDRVRLFVGPAAVDVAQAGALAIAERVFHPLDANALGACATAFTRVAATTAHPERVVAAARWMSFWAAQGFSARPLE